MYGWKDELRDLACECPSAYAVDKAGLIFKAEGGDDYNGAKAWVAVVLLASQACRSDRWQRGLVAERAPESALRHRLGAYQGEYEVSPNRLRFPRNWPSLFRD